jgi:hypothetical protein
MEASMRIAILLIATILTPVAVFANGTGVVKRLAVSRSGHQVLMQLQGSVDPVGCRTRTDYHYYLDLNEDGSKEILAALLAAKASGQTVVVQSTGSCDAPGNGLEVVGYVILE